MNYAPAVPRYAVLVALACPAGLAGQAVCSAPHSSPTLTTSGSIRTLAPGAGWVQLTIYRVQSERFFDAAGKSQRLITDATAVTTSVFATAAVGAVQGLEVWAQIPVHGLRFDDITGRQTRTGFGDPRFSVRIDASLFGLESVPLSVRGGVKLPGSEFPVDSRILPLTEGQSDGEIAIETGHAFASLPAYVVAWAGYRWRGANDRIGRKPGDERYGHLAVGGPVGSLRWELALEALSGLAPEQNGLVVSSSRRRLLQINPTIGWDAGPGTFEAGGQVPVSGRNLPTGAGFSIGYRLGWSL